MKNSHKKVLASVFVGLSVFGCVFHGKVIDSQAAVKVFQEERSLSPRQRRDMRLKQEIENYIRREKSNKFEIIDNFGLEAFSSREVSDLNDFKSKESSLVKGNYLLHIRSVELYIRVK